MTSVEFELIQEIINRVVALVLRDTLELDDYANAVRNIEWRPVWTRNKITRNKEIVRIEARTGHVQNFVKITPECLESMGVHLNEIYEYLSRSNAVRVTATGKRRV